MTPGHRLRRRFPWILAAAFLVAGIAPARQSKKPPLPPSETDKCAVCGMFVAKYTDFLAAIVFKDGAAVYFDGAKDMFTYYFAPGGFTPGRTRDQIEALFVTEYYGLGLIEAKTAWFVVGSDVFGPMGRELIPLKSKAEADQFLKDHKGRAAMAFKDVTPEVVKDIG